jgi:hypothetical protein
MDILHIWLWGIPVYALISWLLSIDKGFHPIINIIISIFFGIFWPISLIVEIIYQFIKEKI